MAARTNVTDSWIDSNKKSSVRSKFGLETSIRYIDRDEKKRGDKNDECSC